MTRLSLKAPFSTSCEPFVCDSLQLINNLDNRQLIFMAKIIAIDDDRAVLHLINRAGEDLGWNVRGFTDPLEGLDAVRAGADVVLLDIFLPRTSGLQLFQQLRELDSRLPIIFITAEAGSDTAIEAMRLGAFDYLSKPLDIQQLRALVVKAFNTRQLMSVPVAVAVNREVPPSTGMEAFVGRSAQMLGVFKAIGQVAGQNITVLIRGESGTGKELVARALYQFGERSAASFMAVNCAALPDTLMESELFGHEKGAFTGADRRRIGKFEQCSGGTLFLDEVGDMSPLLQGKVLRILQDQKFERVGGNETIETDVRLIAATNRPLEEMVAAGHFRGDLFYRLNVITINLPPLRERKDDIPLLLQYFLTKVRHELKRTELEGISPDALDMLVEYPWPGNIRELQSIVRQAVVQARGPVIVPDFLPEIVLSKSSPRIPGDSNIAAKEYIPQRQLTSSFTSAAGDAAASIVSPDFRQFIDSRLAAGSQNLYAEAVELLERYLFTRVLDSTGGNQSRTAETLGITRGKVRDRISAFGISFDKTVSIED